jgi:hypothetical protein
MNASSSLAVALMAYCAAVAVVFLFLVACAWGHRWHTRRRLARLRAEKFDPIRNWRGGRL